MTSDRTIPESEPEQAGQEIEQETGQLNPKPDKRGAGISRRRFAALATGLSASTLLSSPAHSAAQPLLKGETSGVELAAKEAAPQPSFPPSVPLSPAPEFIPDWTFRGSALTGWHPLGNASWKAQNGEIVGTPSHPEGGWLILNEPYQDVQFFARMRSEGAANAGVLLRAEKTGNGMRGIFVSLKEGDLAAYRVTLDAGGKQLTREPLPPEWAAVRFAPPANSTGSPASGFGGGASAGPGEFTSGMKLSTPLPALEPPAEGLGKLDWDQVQIIYDANIVRPYLNNTNQIAPGITGDSSDYGPLALYVGGTNAVRFKDVSFKDLSIHRIEPERLSSRFRKQQLEEFYYGWGVAVGDLNHDGHLDVVAGPYYYLGPDFTRRREYYLGQAYNPSKDYAPNMVTHVHDFKGDGWPDILATEMRAAVLYVNPRHENRRWTRYPVMPQISSEITVLKDIDGDGRPELVYSYHNTMSYAKYDPADPTLPWTVHQVSEPGVASNEHSIGVGDITGNGKMDILGATGWWEHPSEGSKPGPWKYHPIAFGRWGRSETVGGGQIFVYDVNGDGLNDVVTSLHAHGWGLAWYEQKRDSAGKISFVQHMIMDNYSTKNAGGVTFSEVHAMTVADIDGDGVPDIITGKRYWAHLDSYWDPDSYGPAVLYWYRTVRNSKAPGGAEFVPELIHNRSGVGSQLAAVDLNRNGAIDIITATDRGTFIFWGEKHAKRT